MNKLILLNGPPKSGKDYASDIIAGVPDERVRQFKFAQPLRAMWQAVLGIPNSQFDAVKELVVLPFGVTLRQLMIDTSEVFFKPSYGKTIFGELLASKIAECIQSDDQENESCTYVVSDCGFASEVLPVLKLFSPENVTLVRLAAPGKSFDGDSRSYIYLSKEYKTIEVINRYDEDFKTDLLNSLNLRNYND